MSRLQRMYKQEFSFKFMRNTILISLLSLLGVSQLQAQQYKTDYAYDLSGNITSRKTIQLSATRSVLDSLPATRAFEDIATHIKIYPNPTKGFLKIEVSDYTIKEDITILVYDLAGRLLINTKTIDSLIDLDLSSYQNGTYILRLIRNKEKSEWKIIKTN